MVEFRRCGSVIASWKMTNEESLPYLGTRIEIDRGHIWGTHRQARVQLYPPDLSNFSVGGRSLSVPCVENAKTYFIQGPFQHQRSALSFVSLVAS